VGQVTKLTLTGAHGPKGST